MKIRPATATDRAGWLRLRRALWTELDEPAHQRSITRILADRARYTALLALDEDGGAAGLVEVSRRERAQGCRTGPVAWVEGVYVDPARRRHGLGTGLLEAAGRWAEGAGCREMVSAADPDDRGGGAVHAGLGFAPIGRFVLYRKELGSDGEPVATPPATPAAEPAGDPGVIALEPRRAPAPAPAPAPERPAGGRHPLRSRIAARAVDVAIAAAGLAAVAGTDVKSGDVLRGGVAPLVVTAAVIYFMAVFVVRRYRRRADESERAIALFADSGATDAAPRPRRDSG